jgi:hypothetical protein
LCVKGANILAELQRVKDRVLQLYKENPRVANSYCLLVKEYWIHFDEVTGLDDIVTATSPESITRAFRLLVSSQQIEVSKIIRRSRDKRQERIKKELSNICAEIRSTENVKPVVKRRF